MNELKKLLENAGMKPVLKEYLTQQGDGLDTGAGGLNIFMDMLENPISEYEEEFANDYRWMAVEKKYKLIAWELMGAMDVANITLDEYDVDEIHNVWYDGSDAYGDVETALENLPEIYDSQVEAIYAILEGHDGEDLDEQNPDGTISDGEDDEREMLLAGFEAELDELIGEVMDGATEIGGQFRSPGIVAEVRHMLEIKAKSLSSSSNSGSEHWNKWTP